MSLQDSKTILTSVSVRKGGNFILFLIMQVQISYSHNTSSLLFILSPIVHHRNMVTFLRGRVVFV